MSHKYNSNNIAPEDHILFTNKSQLKKVSNKKKSLRQSVGEIYFEYCSNTSIHGVQYFGQQRPWTEIIFWICIFILSIYFCASTVTKIYTKWNETPVIVTLSEQSTPIWKIPFPAVTICSEVKRPLEETTPAFIELYKQLLEEKQNFKPNISSTELDEFLTLLHICEFDDKLSELFNHHPIDYAEILAEMLDIETLYVEQASWCSEFGDFEELFTRTYTENGLCFTFNALNATDLYRENTIQYRQMGLESFANTSKILNRTLSWSMEHGYDADSTIRTYPARVLKSGSKAGLVVGMMHFKSFQDYGCSPGLGFKLLLHAPDNVPQVSDRYVRIPIGKEIRIAIKPNMITTSEGIFRYKPYRRKCYMNSERQLQFFKIYSENNCELECLPNYTLKKCECVKFSMPRTADMPVCGANKIDCYQLAEHELLAKEFLETTSKVKFDHGGETECRCMPACTSLEYDIEISHGDIDTANTLKTRFPGIYSEMSEKNISVDFSVLSIYFKNNEFMTAKRSELYGITDFIANCGGVFGLFMGFSILSFIEVLYHFTLRLWMNIGRKKEV